MICAHGQCHNVIYGTGEDVAVEEPGALRCILEQEEGEELEEDPQFPVSERVEGVGNLFGDVDEGIGCIAFCC